MLSYRGLKENGTHYEQKMGFTDKRGQNILPKVRNISKTGQDQETFKSAFA